MSSEDGSVEGTTFKVYLYIMKAANPVGPREVMRGANLSSPSVAYRHLQKLLDLGLVEKDGFGNYSVKEKISPKGFVWIGKTLIPRLMLYSVFFLGVLIVEIAVVYIRFSVKEPVESTFALLIAITSIATVLFLMEGFILRKGSFR